jgi:cytochrome c peroxidase
MILVGGCSVPGQNSDVLGSELREQIRKEFPDIIPVPIPENNPQTPEKVALGEALFFDPNLSSCGTVACASCHLPEKGFGDGERVSEGCAGATGRRNSNSLYGSGFLSHLFWDGRVQSLEEQALGPIVDPVEMANTWDNVIHYLETGEHLVTKEHFPASARFYKRNFDEIFSGEITSTNVAKAIAAYERTVLSTGSPFDRWLGGDDSALSPAQKQGATVFFGRGRCSNCHPPPNFTDSDFHNVAVQSVGFEKAGMFPVNGQICGGIAEDVDPGRAEVPFLQSSCSDLGKFRTPSLRNVEFSSPYMHNGIHPSLDSVIQHYWRVGRGTTYPIIGTLDEKVQLVMLTDFGGHPDDIINLTEFLKALSGSQLKSPAGGISPPRDSGAPGDMQ